MSNKEYNPLVSVTVITYNSSKFVLETLESIKAQTYQNIELIVSDDCSTDNTVEICREWIEKNKERFVETHLITSPVNTGIPANKNRAIAKCKGEWVKSIAGDDALLENCIVDNIEFCLKNPSVTALQTNVHYFKDHFTKENLIKTSKVEVFPFFSKTKTPNEQYIRILRGNQIIAPSMFIKKDLYSSVGLYDERIPLTEDLPFWTKTLKAGYKIHFSEKVTVKYRIHSKSVAKNGGKIMPQQYAENLLIYSKLYKKANTSWLHYNCYNLSLKATILYHKLGITGKSALLDKVFSFYMGKLKKF